MLGFMYSNSGLVYVIGAILFLVILYFIIKSLPTKAAKKQEKAKADSSETKKEDKPEIKGETEKAPEEKTQIEKKETKNQDKKPKIVQVYKRTSQSAVSGEKQKDDPIYDRNVEFVNVSKNVSKFKTFADETEPAEIQTESQMEDDYGFVTDKQEDCEFCENNVKHFDHSKRMLKAVKNDEMDDMFSSHISDHYLNINSDRHLKLDEKFHRQLFEMTDKMMNNSETKVNNNIGFDLGNNEEIDDELLKDDVKFDMKTALVADTYMHRKKKK